MPEAIKRIGMKEPEHVKIAGQRIWQPIWVVDHYIRVKEGEKFGYHDSIDGCRATWTQVIVFGRTKRRVDELIQRSEDRGFRAEGSSQIDQNKTSSSFVI